MGNLAQHSAEETDNQRAIAGTVEVPVTRDNDAALALGARPNQQHEPAARHSCNDCLFTTLLLTVFTERNFVADFF